MTSPNSLPLTCPVCSFLIEYPEAHICPNCGAILKAESKSLVTKPPVLPYGVGIGLKEVVCFGSGLLTLISLATPWLFGFTPIYAEGTIRSKITAELTGFELFPRYPLLTLLLLSFLIGIVLLFLSLSSVDTRLGGRVTAAMKKLLFTATIPISLIPIFTFTVGYESGTAIIMDSAILSARSGLGPGFSLAFYSVLGFIVAAFLQWLRD